MISIGQMVRVLNSDNVCRLESWERDAIHMIHSKSVNGLRQNLLDLRECQLIITIFNRVYQNA
jgi:hypothetical protein